MKDMYANIVEKISSTGRVFSRKKKNRHCYKDIVCAFDIETTRLEDDNAIMYIWQADFEGITITGRTWEEFRGLLNHIDSELKSNERLIFWVHNLSYEFSFLKGVVDFDDVFMPRPRKILYAVSGNIEFRCSYYLSNMSLEKFLEQMNVENKKLTYDYDKIRYPWTKLNKSEMAYCINDVKGLTQAIRKRLINDGDTLATIPYTSTGYIRRDAKKAYNKYSYAYRKSIMPDLGLYRLLRLGFRGGNCHANRWISGYILDDVLSYDRASSYPDVMCTCLFPVSSFYHLGAVDLNTFYDLLAIPKAIMMKVRLSSVELKDSLYPIPYISRDKCINLKKGIYDNGRVLSAEELTISITDIDYKIIEYQYKFDMKILDLYYARYGRLKQNIQDLIIRDYELKTSLKGTNKAYEYARSKERVNAYYGMTAQDTIKDVLVYVGGKDVYRYAGNTPEELIEKNKKRAFLPYQIGVWVTSWARYRLEQGIRAVHENGGTVCYCDTDSVKFFGYNDNIKAAFDLFNQRAKRAALDNNIVAKDSKGALRPSGVYELDGEYKRFKTLGAKKYVYEDDTGLHITIAGVNKKLGAQELGSIEKFKTGFTFIKAGGLEAVYNDDICEKRIINGHEITITDNVCLRPSTYTIGLAQDYKDLLYSLSRELFFDDLI